MTALQLKREIQKSLEEGVITEAEARGFLKEMASPAVTKQAKPFGRFAYKATEVSSWKGFKRSVLKDFGKTYPSLNAMDDEEWKKLYQRALSSI